MKIWLLIKSKQYICVMERKAKECLYELLKNHHGSQMLKALYEDWDNWARMNNEELQLLNIVVKK